MSLISAPLPSDPGEVFYLQAPVKLLSSETHTGYNIYHSTSVVCQRVDFGLFTHMRSSEIEGDFSSAFLERFLGLQSFVPNNGLTDSFISKLKSPEGVEFDQVLLEAILVVETSVAFVMHHLDTIAYAAIERNDKFVDLIWESDRPKLSNTSAKVGLLGVLELLSKKHYPNAYNMQNFTTALLDLHSLAKRRCLAASTATIKLAAKKRGLACDVVGKQHLRLGQGKSQCQVYASMTSSTSIAAQKVCLDKRLTNRRLKELRLPVPKQVKVGTVDEAFKAVNKLGFPVVIKPLRGSQGEGVTAGINDLSDVGLAFEKAHKSGSDVLVERFIQGVDHRLLVIGGKFVAGLTREPPTIIGDGVSTITSLIDMLNDDPYRDGFRRYQVDVDEEVKALLAQAQVAMNTVLSKGHSIALRTTANVSTGGVPIDVTDQVHPDNREMAERAAKGVGLDVAGIDFMTTDISRSYRESGGALIELNARPGLCIHTWPEKGRARNVAGDLLKLAFPSDSDGYIPIIAVAGDKGTGSVARYLDGILRGVNKSVALALRESAYVNGVSADLTSKQQANAALTLLCDPEVDMLVSTISLRQTAKHGLSLDKCHLSVLMNKVIEGGATLFHDGLDVVVHATTDCFVVDSGNIVALNHLLKHRQQQRLILVSDIINDPILQKHLKAGFSAVSTVWKNGQVKIALLSGSDILATFPVADKSSRDGHTKKRRLKNGKMFAIAAAHGLGLSAMEIQQSLDNMKDIDVS